MKYASWFVAAILVPIISASPALPKAAAAQDEHPLITPSPVLRDATKTYKSRRDILSDLKGDVNSILSELGSEIPSYVASGVPNFFQGFPVGESVRSSLGLDDSQVAALPTQVLNIPWVALLASLR